MTLLVKDYIVDSSTSIVLSLFLLGVVFWLSKRDGQSHTDKAIFTKAVWLVGAGLLILQVYFIVDFIQKPRFTKSQSTFEPSKKVN